MHVRRITNASTCYWAWMQGLQEQGVDLSSIRGRYSAELIQAIDQMMLPEASRPTANDILRWDWLRQHPSCGPGSQASPLGKHQPLQIVVLSSQCKHLFCLLSFIEIFPTFLYYFESHGCWIDLTSFLKMECFLIGTIYECQPLLHILIVISFNLGTGREVDRLSVFHWQDLGDTHGQDFRAKAIPTSSSDWRWTHCVWMFFFVALVSSETGTFGESVHFPSEWFFDRRAWMECILRTAGMHYIVCCRCKISFLNKGACSYIRVSMLSSCLVHTGNQGYPWL